MSSGSSVEVALPPTEGPDVADRILDAALTLVARWGVGKTSLADVAKEAGCSRATVYRTFDGGKQHLFEALGQRELEAYVAAVVEAVDEADSTGDALTRGLVVAARLLRDHDGAQFVLQHEPGLFMPFLGFKQVEVVYRYTADTIGPHLYAHLPPGRAEWAVEWVARLFISYLFNPDERTDLVVVDETRALVEQYVLPAFASDLAPSPSALAG